MPRRWLKRATNEPTGGFRDDTGQRKRANVSPEEEIVHVVRQLVTSTDATTNVTAQVELSKLTISVFAPPRFVQATNSRKGIITSHEQT
ncbi:hypothetical protein J6590_066840 [Homalodisca vitripennis]|nr:hypothetical protein J6590_066840 [Homalodisca vitripennis]